MVIWILVGAGVLGLLILALAIRPVLGAVARLRRAVRQLLHRRAEVEGVRAAALALAERAEELRAKADLASSTMAVIQARRRD